MEHSFELTLDDYLAFNAYHQKNSAFIRRIHLFWVSIIFLLILAASLNTETFLEFIPAAFFLILVIIFLWSSYRSGNPRATKKYFQEGKNLHVLGKKTINLSEDGLRWYTDVSESRFSWKGIERIVVTGQYLFAYIGSVQAFIIPLNSFENTELAEAFVNRLNELYRPEKLLEMGLGDARDSRSLSPRGAGTEIGKSFLKGLGYGLACITIGLAGFALAMAAFEQRLAPTDVPEVSYPSTPQSKQIEILEHRSRKSEYDLDILGRVKNEGQGQVSHVTLEVELFDSEDVFVGECLGYVNGAIKPNGIRNFQIRCGGSIDKPLSEFERYSISVVSSFE